MRDAGLAREVRAAYAHCARVVRRSESSFAAAFWMFSRPRRRALHAIYAFCRLADDIADDPGVRGDRRRLLERWRAELMDAYLGKARHPVGIALGDAVHRFRLPQDVFLDLLRGVESDLLGESMETFEDLRRYCYRVASTVGLLVVHVLEARSPRSFEYAEMLGIAVQLTNVLRDVGEDAATGRIYRALLEELHGRGFPCLGTPLRLPRRRRLAIAASTWLGLEGLHTRGIPPRRVGGADRWAAPGQR